MPRQRVAKQHLETELLMGVDFIPANGASPEAAGSDTSASVEKSSQLADLKARVAGEFPLCETLSDATQPATGSMTPLVNPLSDI